MKLTSIIDMDYRDTYLLNEMIMTQVETMITMLDTQKEEQEVRLYFYPSLEKHLEINLIHYLKYTWEINVPMTLILISSTKILHLLIFRNGETWEISIELILKGGRNNEV